MTNPAPAFVWDALRSFGSHSLAYSVIQPNLEYFGDSDKVIAYRRVFGCTVVLGDPICAPEVLETFLDLFHSSRRRVLFMQVHTSTARVLTRLGYDITAVGVENEISTAAYSLEGKRKRDMRHYRNKAQKGRVTVQREQDTVELRRVLEPVSRAWLPLKSGHGRELEFLARPFLLTPEPEVQIFVARIDAKPVAFTILDPMYRHNEKVGYTVSILRHIPHCPEGTVDFVNLQAIRSLASEGIPLLSLGVSPFWELDRSTFAGHENPLVYFGFKSLYRWGDRFYHFRGLSFHKSRYRASTVPVYCATKGRVPLWPLLASARATGMI